MTRRVVGRTLVLFLAAIALAPRAGAAPPVSLALVIDRSGSLSPEDATHTRELAQSVFASLPAGSEAAVFTFDDQSRLVRPLTTSADEIRAALKEVRISGRYTALHDALYDASRYLRDSGRGRRAILLVTDGKDENSALVLEDGLRVAQDTGIPVFAVGVGRVQERVLRRIAKLTSGRYVSMAEAKGPALAALLAEPGLIPSPGPPQASPKAAPASPSTSAKTSSPPTGSPPAPRSRALWVALLLVVAVVAGVAALGLRGRSRARCPRCDRELPSPLSTCPSCAAPSTAAALTDDADASPTVVARMNITEEYLEKTVTLRERPVLVATHGSTAGQVVRLSPDTTTSIGRAKANDIVLDDLGVSSEHCRIRPEEGRFVLHDLKSTNGTYVNERRVTRHPLAEGDVIRLGETTLQFRMEHRHD